YSKAAAKKQIAQLFTQEHLSSRSPSRGKTPGMISGDLIEATHNGSIKTIKQNNHVCMPSPQLIRGASVAERAPAAMAREASDERGNHSSFRGYLYTQLRTYISLYVRPTDRLVEISTSKLTQSL